jgi:GTPase Era involved in 16S rRNA processing
MDNGNLIARIEQLDALASSFGTSGILPDLQNLAADLHLGLFTIVFLGEFNRGKSTLVNALLGLPLLPMDVTPTTATINVVRSGGRSRILFHRKDQPIEEAILDRNSLTDLVGPGFKEDSLQYVELVIANSALSKGVVFVDTPGVDDMNRQRVDVTTRYIPRADVAVFVLSCANALTRSEVDFLTSAVLESGIARILFVANFADLVDEEERDSFRLRLSNRIKASLPGHSGEICIVSARQALAAQERGDGEALRESGLAEVQAGLQRFQDDNTHIKQERAQTRFAGLIDRFEGEVLAAKRLAFLSFEQLKSQMHALSVLSDEKTQRRERMLLWCHDRERELRGMTRKSLAGFEENLIEEVREQIAAYNGNDLNSFIQHQVTKLIRTRFRVWVDSHSRQLDAFLQRVADNCAISMGKLFNQRVHRLTRESLDLQGISDAGAQIRSGKKKSDFLHAGMKGGLLGGGVAAALGGALMFIGAPFFVPVIGLVAVSPLRDVAHKHFLGKDKQAALPVLQSEIEKMVQAFSDDLTTLLKQKMRQITGTAEDQFEKFVAAYRMETEGTIQTSQQEHLVLAKRKEELEALLLELDKLKVIQPESAQMELVHE